MGSICSAIRDDIDEYHDLCRLYGEDMQYSHGSADCYGEHALGLKKRRDEAWLAEQRARDATKAATTRLAEKFPASSPAWKALQQ